VRWLLIVLIACIALTALKFVVIALALALVIIVLWGAFAHPAETLGTLLFFLFAQAFMAHTAASLAFLGCLGLCLAISGRLTAGPRPPAPDPGD
jgi:hypothetical protein